MAKKKPTKSVFDKAKDAHKGKVKAGAKAQAKQRKKNPGGAPQDKVKAPKTPKAPKVKAALGKRIIDKVGGSVGRLAKRHPVVAAGAAAVGAIGYLMKDVKATKPKKFLDTKSDPFAALSADAKPANKNNFKDQSSGSVRKPAGAKKKVSSADPFAALSVDAKPANKNNFKDQSAGSVRPPSNTKKLKAKVAPPLGGPGGDVKRKDGSAAKPMLKQGANQTLSGRKVAGGKRPKKEESNLPSPKAEGKPTTTPVKAVAPEGTKQAKPHLNNPSALKRALASSGDGPSPKELTTKQVTSSVRGDVDYKANKADKGSPPPAPNHLEPGARGNAPVKSSKTKAAAPTTTKADSFKVHKETIEDSDRYTSDGLFKAGKFGVFGGGGIKTANDKKNIEKRRQKEQNNSA